MKIGMSLIFLLIAITSNAADSFLDLNDVSVLFPLPDAKNWSLLWNGETQASKGALLPLSYLKEVPRLISQTSNPSLYPNIKVLGVRVDPCFHEGLAPIQCRPQVRLIWQPLQLDQNITSTFDASLHSFYDLTQDEFKNLLNELIALKKTKTDKNEFLPLGINPFIKKEGLAGPYTQSFRRIILKYIGEQNLTRITFMQLFMTGKAWIFGGFDFRNGILSPILISRIQSNIQTFNNAVSLDQAFWFLGGISPEPTNETDNLKILVTDSRVIAPQDEQAIKAAVKSAFRFENPETHNPGTVDCVSCHVAQPAKAWAIRQYPWFQFDILNQQDIYQSERDLRNLSPMQSHTNILRAFGYFANNPFVAQRTINETAAVIKYIHQNF